MEGLVTAFTDALRRQLGAQCQVFRYKADFARLWSDQVVNDKPVLIVWEEAHLGDPNDRDEMLLEKNLTPLDWALAWSLHNAAASLPLIIIIDLTPASWAQSWAWGVRHQLAADMPWLQLTSLVPTALPGKQPHVLAMQPPASGEQTENRDDTEGVIRRTRDADGVPGWSLQSDWKVRDLLDEEKAALIRLSDLWVGSLTQTDEHHDINNLIGGWMLLAEHSNAPETRTTSATVNAFLTKTRWSNRTSSASLRYWQPRKARRDDPDLYGRRPRVTIYDDKASAGWEEVIKIALRDVTDDVVQGELSDLVDLLGRSQFHERQYKQTAEIMLLDLRLYESPSSEAFRGHATRLVKKAREIGRQQIRLAWSPIDAVELTKIENWLGTKERDDDLYLKTLLLLPRMAALAWPLTPIILFSSSTQASVRELLKPYGNIFTGFQKPNPLKDPQSLGTSADAFSRSIDFALPLLRRGIQLAELSRVASQLNDRPAKMRSAHADLYFDESGQYVDKSGNPTLGVISALACNIYKEDNVSQAIQQSFLYQFDLPAGVVWSRPEGTTASPQLKKGSTFREDWFALRQVSMLRNHLMGVDGALAFSDRWLVSGIRSPAYCPTDRLTSQTTLSAFHDLLLDRAIRANLFFALFVYIPYICSCDDITISIHLPTRVLPMEVGGLDGRFCLFRVSHEKVMTYSRDAAFPLVRAWLQSWGAEFEAVSKRIISIAGRTLDPPEGIPNNQRHRGHLFHNVADWAAGSIGVDGKADADETARIQMAFNKNNLYERRFTLIDNESDLLDLEKLLVALSDILKAPLSHTTLVDVIAGLERSEIIATRTGLARLRDDISLAHHRMVVWSLMAHLKKASGEALMPSRTSAV